MKNIYIDRETIDEGGCGWEKERKTEAVIDGTVDHVNNKKFKKSKKTLEVGGWVKCPIGNLKKLEYKLIHYFIMFLGEHANVNNIINALL